MAVVLLETELKPIPPFSLDLTARHRTQGREELGLEHFVDGTYHRLCKVENKLALISLREEKKTVVPALHMKALGDELVESDLEPLRKQVEWLLGLDYDLSGFYEMAKEDPRIERFTHRLWGLKPAREIDVFQSLVTAVTGQQISGAVARAIRQELIHSYGEPFFHQNQVFYQFPTPQRLIEAGLEELRKHKLSQRKAEYIYGIAKAVTNGELNIRRLNDLSNQAAIEELVKLRGVGVWTAQWILSAALGRFDVFPAGDLVLLKMVSRLYRDGEAVTPEEAAAIAERWGEYQFLVVAYWYAGLRLGIDLFDS